MVNLQVKEKFKIGDQWLGIDVFSANAEKHIEVRRYYVAYFYPFLIKIETSPIDMCFKIGFFRKFYIGINVGKV